MHNLVIGIPTYKRPGMLNDLLRSIFQLRIEESKYGSIFILIIDNDNDKTAESVLKEIPSHVSSKFTLIYHNYPIRGLSNVRNELIRRSLELDVHYILCIDDDEYVTKDWLESMVTTITKYNGDIAVGPVFPVLEEGTPSHISYWFRKRNLPEGTSISFYYSGNCIIKTEFILKNKLRFDNRFNKTGGEDTYFGVIALNKGARIFWSRNAIAYETIPKTRTNLRWLLFRQYRGAITYTYILRLEKKYLNIIKKLILSVIYIILGCLSIVIIPFPIPWRFWGLLTLIEGCGGFAGILNIQYYEYK